jgi:hypothetical protein
VTELALVAAEDVVVFNLATDELVVGATSPTDELVVGATDRVLSAYEVVECEDEEAATGTTVEVSTSVETAEDDDDELDTAAGLLSTVAKVVPCWVILLFAWIVE